MTTAFLLLTAMPPTVGHAGLIRFAARLAREVVVILCTQPGEPYVYARAAALYDFINDGETLRDRVRLVHIHETMEQNPEAPGFWDMWRKIMTETGAVAGDLVVASETYGKTVAALFDGKFMPYDIERDLQWSKGEYIREDVFAEDSFHLILPQFQPWLKTVVTIFGAESTGKTTMMNTAEDVPGAVGIFEYARPYLESVVNEITTETMTDIWHGQRALQDHALWDIPDKHIIVQDTDLFSTVGYWGFWRGDTPAALVEDAAMRASDLYLIMPSNIPFEADPLRYGGDKRESEDRFWIDLCKKHNLNCAVVEGESRQEKEAFVWDQIMHLVDEKAKTMRYDRKGL